jgi:membrane-associated phospholipid phosphatase
MKPPGNGVCTQAAREGIAGEWSSNLLSAGPLRDAFARAWQVCGVCERLTLVYFAWVTALLILFHRHVPHAPLFLLIQIGSSVAILWMASAAAHSSGPVFSFARHWHPLAVYIFCFEELRVLVHAIFPGWFDRWLIAFDCRLAGGADPSVWLARFATPTLNDFMQFAYMTYFVYLVLLPALLYACRERRAFWTVMASTALANYSIYVIAVLFPIESPHFALATLEAPSLDGGWCTAAINLIERFGRVHGGAFPSAHVAGSLVAMCASWRYRRWLFWVCLPFFASMCAATVYGRYHYIADVLAGLVVGGVAWIVGQRLMNRRLRGRNSRAETRAPSFPDAVQSSGGRHLCHAVRSS